MPRNKRCVPIALPPRSGRCFAKDDPIKCDRPSIVAKTSLTSSSFAAGAYSLMMFIVIAAILPLPAEAFSFQDAVSGIEAAVQAAGPLGPLVFILAYVIATVLLLPGSLLTLIAGFLFGPVFGSVIVSIAATLGAAAAFLVGRYLARPAVSRLVEKDVRFAAVDLAIASQGSRIVFLLRLSPLLPFSLLNYALSLTNIPLSNYVLASWAGMLPGTIAYVALGGVGKAAAESAAGIGSSPIQFVLYGIGALATLGATVLISRAASNALKEASDGTLGQPLDECDRNADPVVQALNRNRASRLSTSSLSSSIMPSPPATEPMDTFYPHGMTPLRDQGVPVTTILKRLGSEENSEDSVQVLHMTQPSAFVQPQSVFFHLDGKRRRWDMVNSHASVAILIYHTGRNEFILVRQFRPAVYATANRHEAQHDVPSAPLMVLPLERGLTFELCAGIVGDKPGYSLEETAREEILEETGYDVPLDKIEKLTSFLSAVGISGSRQTIFTATVDDSMLAATPDVDVGGGLAEHGEAIEVVGLPRASVDAFLMDERLNKSAGLMFALTWAMKTGMFT